MTTFAWILICCLCFCGGATFALITFLIIDEIYTNQLIKDLTKEERNKVEENE